MIPVTRSVGKTSLARFGQLFSIFLLVENHFKKCKKILKPRFPKILSTDFDEIVNGYGEAYCHAFHQILCFYCKFCPLEIRSKKASLPKLYMSPFAKMSLSVNFGRYCSSS